jgi:hypothetical protein
MPALSLYVWTQKSQRVTAPTIVTTSQDQDNDSIAYASTSAILFRLLNSLDPQTFSHFKLVCVVRFISVQFSVLFHLSRSSLSHYKY